MIKSIVFITLNGLLLVAGLMLLTVGIAVCFDPRVVKINPFVVPLFMSVGVFDIGLVAFNFVKFKVSKND